MSDDQYFHADLDNEDDYDDVIENVDPSNNNEMQHINSIQENGYIDSETAGLNGPLRKGKWTPEEETYANKIISYFNKGLLSIESGTTLRSYLSEKLNCDPMRITKKFAGASCIGKQVFQPSDTTSSNSTTLKRVEEELSGLEKSFLKRLYGKSLGGSTNNLLEEETTPRPARNFSFKSKLKFEYAEKSNRPKRISSMPDFATLDSYNNSSPKTSSSTTKSGLSKKRRSQSLMDLDRYEADDTAAGDLLLKFMEKMTESASKRQKKILNSPTQSIKSFEYESLDFNKNLLNFAEATSSQGPEQEQESIIY